MRTRDLRISEWKQLDTLVLRKVWFPVDCLRPKIGAGVGRNEFLKQTSTASLFYITSLLNAVLYFTILLNNTIDLIVLCQKWQSEKSGKKSRFICCILCLDFKLRVYSLEVASTRRSMYLFFFVGHQEDLSIFY